MSVVTTPPPAQAWRDTTTAVSTFGGSLTDIGRGLAPMSDGGFVSAGFTTSNPMTIDSIVLSSASGTRSAGTDRDMFLVRHDANGTAIWAKAFGGPGPDYLYSVETDAQDNIYVAGSLMMSGNFPSGVVSGTTRHPLVAKLDSAGNVLWFRELPATAGTTMSEAFSLVPHPSGGVLVAGAIDGDANFGGRSGTTATTDAFVARYSESGVLVWVAKIFGAGEQIVERVTVGANGDVHAVGTASDSAVLEDATGTQSTPRTMPALKGGFHVVFSADGARRSETYFEASTTVQGLAGRALPDGSSLVALAVSGSITIGSTALTASTGDKYSVLIKRDPNGAVVWVRDYRDTTFSVEPRDIVVATDGAVWMTGTLNRGSGKEQIYVARYLADGTPSFPSPLLFGDQLRRSIGQKLSPTGGGEVMLTGRFGGGAVNPQDPNDQITASGDSDVLIMKLTPNGNLASATTTTSTTTSTTMATTAPTTDVSATASPIVASTAPALSTSTTSPVTEASRRAQVSEQSIPATGRSVTGPMTLAAVLVVVGVVVAFIRRRRVE